MGKQNYIEWKLAESKRPRKKLWKVKQKRAIAEAKAKTPKTEGKPEDWLSARLVAKRIVNRHNKKIIRLNEQKTRLNSKVKSYPKQLNAKKRYKIKTLAMLIAA